jgi:hypothetical protein
VPIIGAGRDVEFSTGSSEDTTAPEFDGLLGVRWDYEREFDGCSETFSERYVFYLVPSEPSDDSPSDLLSVLVFQTEGRGIDSPTPIGEEPYRAGEPVRVENIAAHGVGRVCFAALVKDSVGNSSGGLDQVVCTDTEEPPFFEGCSLSPSRVADRGWPVGLLFMLAGGLGLGMRRRPQRPAL